jgi:hypothetical protein
MSQPSFTAKQFRQAQDRLRLSDSKLALMLGCTDVQVRRMKVEDESLGSHRPVSPVTARLLQAYLDGYRPKDWPG